MTQALDILELLATVDAQVVIPPPGDGDGYWAGGPSAVWHDGTYYLAYRLRRPVTEGRGYANVVARSDGRRPVRDGRDGDRRPVRLRIARTTRPWCRSTDGWRLYVSCSTLNSKHWWVEAIEANDLDGLADGRRTVVLAGDEATAWKDIVVRRSGAGWQMWACRHPLDGGDDAADRMTSVYLTSEDGLAWTAGEHCSRTDGRHLGPARHADHERRAQRRVWLAFYDGRASAEENWFERTGAALGSSPDRFEPIAGPTPAGRTIRYLSPRRDDVRHPALLGGVALRRRQRPAHRVRAAPAVAQPVLKVPLQQLLQQRDVLGIFGDELAPRRASGSDGRWPLPRCSAASSGRCACRQIFGGANPPSAAPPRTTSRRPSLTSPGPAQDEVFDPGIEVTTPGRTPRNRQISSRTRAGSSISSR